MINKLKVLLVSTTTVGQVCSLAGSDFSLAVQVDLSGYLPKFIRFKNEGTIMISSLPVPLHS